jgi:hypothetical protein
MAKVIFRQEAIDDLSDIWNILYRNGLKIKLTIIMRQLSLPLKKSAKILTLEKNILK